MRVLILSVLLGLAVQCQAQNNDPGYMFDDGNAAEVDNVIKISVFGLLTRELAVYYEKAISRSFSVEIGAGYAKPGMYNQIFPEDPQRFRPTVSLAARYYFNSRMMSEVRSSYRRPYLNLQYKMRDAHYENISPNELDRVQSHEFYLHFGKQYYTSLRLVIEANIGAGIAYYNPTFNGSLTQRDLGYYDFDSPSFLLNFAFKLGYRL